MKEPFRVGITGTVAGGKSTVGRLLESWGAARLDADQLAREAVRPGSVALGRIHEVWGDAVLGSDGALDRRAMADIVFDDDAARARLEAIVHPAIRELRAARLEEAREAGISLLVEEVPLLFERDLDEDYDLILTVDAPRRLRAERAAETRGWTPETFDAVDASQLAAEDKRRRADLVIDNDGDRDSLERAARSAWSRILELAGQHPGGLRVDDPSDGT